MAADGGQGDADAMSKRIASVFLWFYVTWVAWNVVAFMTGLSVMWGPVVAAAVSAFVAGDPMHRIWAPRSVPSQ